MLRFFLFKDMNDNKKFTYLLLYVTPLSLDNFFQSASKTFNRGMYSTLRDFFHSFSSKRFNASPFELEDKQAFFSKMDQILKSMGLRSGEVGGQYSFYQNLEKFV